jgi:hypothetical protein
MTGQDKMSGKPRPKQGLSASADAATRLSGCKHRRPGHARSMLKGDRDRHMLGIQSFGSIVEVDSLLAPPGRKQGGRKICRGTPIANLGQGGIGFG